MRFLAAAALVLTLLPNAALADPARGASNALRAPSGTDRLRIGAETHWSPGRFEERLGVGLSWCVPGRWYDADGALLTERSLLHPGRDLERPGLYLALRF
jgi:hypothetical protein